MYPTLKDLLSRQASILHTTRRSYFEKRIVEFDASQYVLYRLPSRASALQFADIIERAAASGAELQNIVARPTPGLINLGQSRWLALTYLPGEPIHGKHEDLAIFASLGKTLAILHRQSATRRGALLHSPALAPLLDAKRHTPPVAQWLAESQKRLANLHEYRLTHGDLYSGNIIVTPGNTSALIDYELFAYDLPGIELGTLLLRHICRTAAKRQAALSAYLEHCDPATRQLWEAHWQDFLVAAALRISAQRSRRHNILKTRHERLTKILYLPLPERLRYSISNNLEAQGHNIKSAHKSREQHQRLAKILINLLIRGRVTDPNTLITQCFIKNKTRRKTPAKPVRRPA